MEARVIPRSGFDLARMLGLGRVLVEEDLQLEPHRGRRSRVVEPSRPSRDLMDSRVVTEGPAAGPRALMFRDSFGSAMIPFLSEHFSRAVYLWQTNFDPGQVTRERPDVVIQEWVGPPPSHGVTVRRRRGDGLGFSAVTRRGVDEDAPAAEILDVEVRRQRQRPAR